jgi:HEAT repeat protein
VEPLVTALRDERWWVQKAAAQALEQLGWQPGDDMQRALLATIAMTSLVAELRGESHDSHMATAQALGQLGDARAVKELVRLADTDHFPGCGKTAINALERILERNAARLASEDLQRIAQLLGVFEEHCEAYMDPDALVFRRESVDCSYVKQLARQELIRRGLLA